MAERQWTPQQADAIAARGGTVLVSAAAGSGKTAVLVERVVGRILDEKNPVDADRLLIVTFSNAAALEMKQRIMARMSELIAAHPEDRRLRRQQLLLGRAQISTIHSFCLELIRSNFQALGIASNTRAADERELEIMRRDCARACIEQFLSDDADGGFSQLVELLSAGRDDRRVFDTLFSLYDFVRAHPFYNDWLDDKLAYYGEGVRAADSIWGRCILDYAKGALGHAASLLRRALALAAQDEAVQAAYGAALSGDLLQLEQTFAAVTARDWDRVQERLRLFTFEKLRPLRGDSPQKSAVQALRKSARAIVEELRDRQFCASSAEFLDDVAFLRPMVSLLFDLTRAFDRLFTEQKQQKYLMDFSDMEQYAISLLVKKAGPGYAKTELAQAAGALYDEVLIDEFQDTNAAQEIIFRAVSQNESNLFMVGDVKQSIYRFRQAMPELFIEKKKRFAPYDGKTFPAKIVLGKNFRSAQAVTGCVNFFFSQLMSGEIGEVDYNQEEALSPGASFPEGIEAGCTLRLIDASQYAGELDRTQLEAREVAEQIAAMLERGDLVADGGVTRRIRPSDICVLLRSPAQKAQAYFDALTRRGVPVWAEPKSGFLTSREIAPVVALLRVLGNPTLDIDFASALLSPLFGLTADELTQIRLADRRAPLYIAAARAAGAGDSRAANAVDTIARLRRFAANATADAVIRKIYEECDYMGKVQAMRMGQARRANLLLLVQYACDYHAGGYKGLSGFIGFVDRLIDRGGDFAPAASMSEQADVVRVMSIHRSKGLEFPVVFLCDTAKRFNREDLNGNTLLHSELGFACVRRDFELMKQYTTVPMQALRLELERSMLSEELRVLYVALTRAKQRIVITGVVTKPEERLCALVSESGTDGKLPPHQVRGANAYLDWILMAAARHPALAERFGLAGAPLDASEAPLTFELKAAADGEPDAEKTSETTAASPDEAALEALRRRLAFRYPFEAQTKIPTKMAVSQLAGGAYAASYRFSARPAFLQGGGLTGAQRGNALHKFMQFADYQAAARDASGEIARMAREGFLSRQEADSIRPDRVRAFFSSRLAARIFSAKQVWRELRFLAEAGERELGAYSALFTNGGETAIQGVADCVFLEEDGAVIVDYKTDRVKTPDELRERYRVQLALYRNALTEALGVPVKECVLYSFALSCEIVL